jgi:hypothetical protein
MRHWAAHSATLGALDPGRHREVQAPLREL